MKNVPAFLAALLCLGACAGTAPDVAPAGGAGGPGRAAAVARPAFSPGAPEWVARGTSSRFPKERYIVGIGESENRELASDKARAEIAKVFSIYVRAESLFNELYVRKEGQGADDTSFRLEAEQMVKTSTEKIFQGVEVAESWQDPGTRRIHALAVLEKGRALRITDEKLSEIDPKIARLKEEYDRAADRVSRVNTANRLQALAAIRGALNDDRRVLAGEGKPLPQPIDGAELLARALSEIVISVSAEGKGSREVATEVTRALNAVRLKVREGGDPAGADLSVTCISSVHRGQRNEGWEQIRAELSVTFVEKRSGKIALEIKVQDRQTSADYNDALRRAIGSAAGKAAEEIRQKVPAYLGYAVNR